MEHRQSRKLIKKTWIFKIPFSSKVPQNWILEAFMVFKGKIVFAIIQQQNKPGFLGLKYQKFESLGLCGCISDALHVIGKDRGR